MRVRVSRRIVSICVIFLCTAPVMQSQEKPEPPRRQGGVPLDSTISNPDQKLPQIDLPEFLITGNESINLPEFSKTTLDENRLYDASARKPGPGAREASSTQLGIATKEQVRLRGSDEGLAGKIIAGYGSFTTPFFDGWFGKSFSNSDFLLKGGYRSSYGHVANADYRNGYSTVSAGVNLPEDASFLGGSRVQGSIGFQGESYRLYGSANPFPQRTQNRFTSGLTLNGSMVEPFSYVANVHFRNLLAKDSLRSRQTVVAGEFTGSGDIGRLTLKGDLSLWGDFYDAPSDPGNPHYSSLSIGGRYRFDAPFEVTGGGIMSVFRGSDTKSLVRVYPRLGVSWFASSAVTLFASFEPYVQRNGLAQMLDANPYLFNDVRIRHQEVFNNFSIGAESEFTRKIKSRISFTYKRVNNFPIFFDPTGEKVWAVEYFGTTRILSFQGDLFADLTDADYIAGSLLLRSSKNSGTDKTVPYLPSAQLTGTYQHRFPFGLLLGASVKLVGQQYVDAGNLQSLSAFTLVDVHGEFTIVRGLSIIGTLTNAFNTPFVWWEGYAGQNRFASLALGYAW